MELSQSQQKSLFNVNSSSTLQHSSISWTIPKDKRLKYYLNQDSQTDRKILLLPSTLSKRMVNFGIKPSKTKIAMQNILTKTPGPNQYYIKSQFDKNAKEKKGITFGLTYNKFRKNYYPEFKHCLIPEWKSSSLGPGQYDFEKSDLFGSKAKKIGFSQFGRSQDLSIKLNNANYQYYKPDESLIKSARYSKISFGYGNRTFVKGNDVPGPGAYNIDSISKLSNLFKKIQAKAIIHNAKKAQPLKKSKEK